MYGIVSVRETDSEESEMRGERTREEGGMRRRTIVVRSESVGYGLTYLGVDAD